MLSRIAVVAHGVIGVDSILGQAIELFAVLYTSILLYAIIQAGDYFFNLGLTSIGQ